MNASRFILPAAAFGFSLALTVAVRNAAGPSIPPKAELSAGISPSHRTKCIRESREFAAISALLRDGRIDDARERLRKLGARDPVAFFQLLSKLPGLPGMDDIIRETAAKLPWNQSAITELLNGIATNEWRDLAWGAYATSRVGLVPDEEVFEVGGRAREYVSMSALGGLFKDAAEKRPDAFLAFLNTTNSTSLREFFFGELMKFHPERAGELFKTIPDGSPGSAYDKSYILSERVKALPTAENLRAVLLERGERGIFDDGAGSFLVCGAIMKANPQQKAEILDWIGTQPPIARNRLLDGIVFSTVFERCDPIAPAEFSKVLSTYTSGYMQEQALETWLKRNKDLDQTDPNWIDQLPTERLRNHALDLRKKRESERR